MFAERIPWMLGGSADLAPSTKTLLTFDGASTFTADTYAGRNFHFGIREHGMAAAVNGMTISGLRAYGATFFVFSDYCRPSMRLASIMNIPSLHVFTHDSIGVGEDGPTHQPVEHLCLEAHEKLKAEGIRSRVVSMPCWSLFAKQDQAYRESVLPSAVRARVAVEMGATLGWERFVGLDGAVVGMTTFGASAPLKDLLKHFGFTIDAVMAAARQQLGGATA
jgi:transketolase